MLPGTSCSSSLVGVERLAELVVSPRNAAWSMARGGRGVRRAATTRRWWCCTPGCWSAALVEVALADRPFLPVLGWPMLAAGARRAGAALVVHQHARAAVEHPGDRRARPAAGRPRPLPLAAPPQLRRRRGRGARAAAGAHGLGHRAGVHGAQRRAAAVRIRAEDDALLRDARRRHDRRARGRRRRAGGPGHRHARRPGRAGGGGRRAARRPRRQGLRRGADAGRRRGAGGARSVPIDRLRRCAASATSTAGRAARRPCSAGHRAGGAPDRPARRAGRGPRATRASCRCTGQARARSSQDDVRCAGRRRRGPATWWPPTACTRTGRRSARCWACRAPAAAARYGLRRHFAVPPWTDLVEVHWSRAREAYVTPVGRRTWSAWPS